MKNMIAKCLANLFPGQIQELTGISLALNKFLAEPATDVTFRNGIHTESETALILARPGQYLHGLIISGRAFFFLGHDSLVQGIALPWEPKQAAKQPAAEPKPSDKLVTEEDCIKLVTQAYNFSNPGLASTAVNLLDAQMNLILEYIRASEKITFAKTLWEREIERNQLLADYKHQTGHWPTLVYVSCKGKSATSVQLRTVMQAMKLQ